MTMPGGRDERIAILDIDEKSLAEVGRWPGAAGSYGYLVESRLKRRLAARFREYVPPEVVARMELDPERYDKPRAPSSQFCSPISRLHRHFRKPEPRSPARLHRRVPHRNERCDS